MATLMRELLMRELIATEAEALAEEEYDDEYFEQFEWMTACGEDFLD